MKSQVVVDERTDKERNVELEYPLNAPNADGSVVEVAEGVLWLRMPLPMALDHINLYLLEDNDGWYIVDTGLDTKETRHLWEHVTQTHCKGKPIKGVICTHFHYDHSNLSSWLTERFNVPLFMTHGEFYTLKANSSGLANLGNEHQLAFYQRSGVPQETIENIFEACRRDPFIKHSPPSFNRLRSGDILTINSRQWSIIIGEGHSPEHACLYCEEDKLLIAGDQLLPHISSNILINDMEPNGQQLKYWLRSLKNLQCLRADILVLPAHGPIFTEIHARAQQLIEHHLDTLNTLRDYATSRDSFTAFEATNHLFDRELSPINRMMALGETLAHINWLMGKGYLIANTDLVSGINIYKHSDAQNKNRIKL
ncbi:MBL fold metallo-hydrolase [Aliiglaciecola lipolytica]|uniref:Beta-lactamase-like protein n=1 Tax=Aliiglaciecola lipolytica E3 TaxID=1127673 RepID=K6YRQ6_9ALTE|nr:MBL fold metallo-hydrolase [Aliiglaciecola lipolytica]GAC14000.1 beta-lactamase-like protein [Aliiglaciecola lipolytica E3]